MENSIGFGSSETALSSFPNWIFIAGVSSISNWVSNLSLIWSLIWDAISNSLFSISAKALTIECAKFTLSSKDKNILSFSSLKAWYVKFFKNSAKAVCEVDWFPPK